MKVDVYDTYVRTEEGDLMHFDVFLPSGEGHHMAAGYAHAWLRDIGVSPEELKQESCNFCHRQAANPALQSHIERHGYFILQMEGCPSPGQQP
jgi:hypothetical protein